MALRGRRWYGDFREYADVGGRIEALKPKGKGVGTKDRDIAIKLGAERILSAHTDVYRGLARMG